MDVSIKSSRTDVILLLDELKQNIFVRDRMGEFLSDIQVKADDFVGFTDSNGMLSIEHAYLNDSLKVMTTSEELLITSEAFFCVILS